MTLPRPPSSHATRGTSPFYVVRHACQHSMVLVTRFRTTFRPPAESTRLCPLFDARPGLALVCGGVLTLVRQASKDDPGEAESSTDTGTATSYQSYQKSDETIPLRLAALTLAGRKGGASRSDGTTLAARPKAAAADPIDEQNAVDDRPAPPVLPAGWVACWSDEHSRYYFCHDETGKSTWQRPPSEARVGQHEPKQGRDLLSKAPASRSGTGAVTGHSSSIEPQPQPKQIRILARPTSAVSQAVERQPTSQGCSQQREKRSETLRESSDITGRSSDKSNRPPSASGGDAAIRAPASGQTETKSSYVDEMEEPEEYIATDDWMPPPNANRPFIQLIRGKRVSVFGIATKGWAYGSIVGDPEEREGYCPLSYLYQRPRD